MGIKKRNLTNPVFFRGGPTPAKVRRKIKRSNSAALEQYGFF